MLKSVAKNLAKINWLVVLIGCLLTTVAILSSIMLRGDEDRPNLVLLPVQSIKNSTGMEMILVEKGKFRQGSDIAYADLFRDPKYKFYLEIRDTDFDFPTITGRPSKSSRAFSEDLADETPARDVEITYSYFLGATEVTISQWQSVMGSVPMGNKIACSGCPVVFVSIEDIEKFLRRLNSMEDGMAYRLPSETEWEFAATWGLRTELEEETLGETAWFERNSEGHLQTVASKRPNLLGFFDMQGNASEVCADTWNPGYRVLDSDGMAEGYSVGESSSLPKNGDANIETGFRDWHVSRGGAFDDPAFFLRTTSRRGVRSIGNGKSGFRIAANFK